jgi:hypothetical protein
MNLFRVKITLWIIALGAVLYLLKILIDLAKGP